jgi:hypothetical protein
MDFFTLPHQKQPAVTEDEDGATESFARAIDDRFNNPAPAIPSAVAHNLPLSLSLSSIARNNNLPSPHSSRSHSHHFPTPSPEAALFTPVAPAESTRLSLRPTYSHPRHPPSPRLSRIPPSPCPPPLRSLHTSQTSLVPHCETSRNAPHPLCTPQVL